MHAEHDAVSPLDLGIGLSGAALTAALLVTSQRLFGLRLFDTDVLASLLLLAAGGQAVPLLGLAIAGRALLLRWSHSDTPAAARAPKQGDNIGLVFVVAFALAFVGVFALLYSSVFIPLVVSFVLARVFYRPLSRNTPRARATWRVMALSSLGFGAICVVFALP